MKRKFISGLLAFTILLTSLNSVTSLAQDFDEIQENSITDELSEVDNELETEELNNTVKPNEVEDEIESNELEDLDKSHEKDDELNYTEEDKKLSDIQLQKMNTENVNKEDTKSFSDQNVSIEWISADDGKIEGNNLIVAPETRYPKNKTGTSAEKETRDLALGLKFSVSDAI